MSLDYFKSEIEGLRAQGAALQKEHSTHVRNIDRDPNLSDAGKASARNDALASYKPRASALRAKEEALITSKINDLQRQLESRAGLTSTDIIAFRDAQDRADRVTDASEALTMIQRAMRQGDTSLAHALFRRANEARWGDVMKAFLAENPTLDSVIRQLDWVTEFEQNKFPRTMAYAILSR